MDPSRRPESREIDPGVIAVDDPISRDDRESERLPGDRARRCQSFVVREPVRREGVDLTPELAGERLVGTGKNGNAELSRICELVFYRGEEAVDERLEFG